jgi:hypothetical protein
MAIKVRGLVVVIRVKWQLGYGQVAATLRLGDNIYWSGFECT